MNKWPHLLAALALAVMVFVIHILVRNDSNVNKLDVVRFYTMVREKGDVGLALTYLNTQNAGMNDACARLTNLSLTDAATIACRATRQTARDNILTAMKCDKFSSQVCSFLQRAVSVIISANRTAANTWVQGKDLTAKVPGYDITYRQAVFNAVQEAPNILHNAFWARQDSQFIVLRTTLFNLISITALANILVHISDAMWGWSWHWRLAMRVGYFIASFLIGIIGVYTNGGSVPIVLGLLFAPALISLIYFELFLDDPDMRPWVHPYAFSIIFACTSLLALTENNVLNASVIVTELLKAQAASQLYMEVVWYWTGYLEKKRLKSELTEIYKTQQVQYALFMGIVATMILPLFQFLAPYDFTNADIFLRIAPLVFAFIAVVGTIFLQALILDDEYGIDNVDNIVNHKLKRHGVGPVTQDSYVEQNSLYKASRITGGKLGVSMLVLIFIALVEFDFVAEYFRTLRAYLDVMPERSIQYDLSRTYLWGAGLTTPGVFTL